MAKGHVLVVDDEEDILKLLEFNFTREGYQVSTATSGEAAISAIRKNPPDAIVLDLMLPGVDGLDLCRSLKSDAMTVNIPVIMLTAKSGEADVVTGLEIGADDYVPKPFSPRVLLARVKAVLRRRVVPDDSKQVYRYGALWIHTAQHQVKVDHNDIDLTATEFRILLMLARRPGWVFGRDQIVDSVQGGVSDVTSRSVDVHIVNLRRKLAKAGDLIETVRGIGYRMRDTRGEE